MLAHLAICILTREGPRDAAAFGVTALLPSGDFSGEQRAVGQAPVKALAVNAADLDFCPVEPVRRRGLGRASLGAATNHPSAGKPAPTSPRPRSRLPISISAMLRPFVGAALAALRSA